MNYSYSKTDSQKACAALVVLAYPSFDVLYEDYEIDTTDYPYIPGFLAFKEIPSLTILFNRLKSKSPEFWPQVLLVDGNGILHNRGFGAASHIGMFTLSHYSFLSPIISLVFRLESERPCPKTLN